MSIEGGSRLLQRAIKGLAPVEREKKVARLNVKDRLGPPVGERGQEVRRREARRGGRGEEGQKVREDRGRLGERIGERRKKVSGVHGEHKCCTCTSTCACTCTCMYRYCTCKITMYCTCTLYVYMYIHLLEIAYIATEILKAHTSKLKW